MSASTVEFPKEKLSSTHKSSELNVLISIFWQFLLVMSANMLMFPPMPVGWVLIQLVDSLVGWFGSS